VTAIARALFTAAATAALLTTGTGAAHAAPAVCGTTCGTDAPYSVQTTMQQKLAGQTATGTAKTQGPIEAALGAMRDQLTTLTGGAL
jgi:hypothetical protein